MIKTNYSNSNCALAKMKSNLRPNQNRKSFLEKKKKIRFQQYT